MEFLRGVSVEGVKLVTGHRSQNSPLKHNSRSINMCDLVGLSRRPTQSEDLNVVQSDNKRVCV